MKLITKVELTEKEKEIVKQAKNFYNTYSNSSFPQCNGELANCDDCPFYAKIDFVDHCILKDVSESLENFIKGVGNV